MSTSQPKEPSSSAPAPTPSTGQGSSIPTTMTEDLSFDKTTKRLDHILIAVDGSPSSAEAFEWAKKKFIDPLKHVVYLLAVARINPQASMIYSAGIGGGIPWTMLEEINKEGINDAKKIVLQHHHILKDSFHSQLECHSLIGQGDARDEIVDAVDKIHADLLILGSRGLGTIKRTFLGSTGDYCVHHAHCNVVIIKYSGDVGKKESY